MKNEEKIKLTVQTGMALYSKILLRVIDDNGFIKISTDDLSSIRESCLDDARLMVEQTLKFYTVDGKELLK